ncbi:MAG: hypothetical protein V8R89_04765 [Alphaproteobacteria bacterium]
MRRFRNRQTSFAATDEHTARLSGLRRNAFFRKGIINNHFDYIRTALSEKDGNREAKETKNLTADRGNAADVSVYDLLSRQRE